MWNNGPTFADVLKLGAAIPPGVTPMTTSDAYTLSPPSLELNSPPPPPHLTPIRSAAPPNQPKTAPPNRRQQRSVLGSLSPNHANANTPTGDSPFSFAADSRTNSSIGIGRITTGTRSYRARQLIPPPSARISRRSDPRVHFDDQGQATLSSADPDKSVISDQLPSGSAPRNPQMDVAIQSKQNGTSDNVQVPNTPTKQVTMLKRINLVRSRCPLSTPTMQSMRHKVLSTRPTAREEVQNTLARYERRIALEDRANAVRALLIQAARERVIDPDAVSILQERVDKAILWVKNAEGKCDSGPSTSAADNKSRSYGRKTKETTDTTLSSATTSATSPTSSWAKRLAPRLEKTMSSLIVDKGSDLSGGSEDLSAEMEEVRRKRVMEQRISLENKRHKETLNILIQIDQQVRRVRRRVLTSRTHDLSHLTLSVEAVVKEIAAATAAAAASSSSDNHEDGSNESEDGIVRSSSSLPHSLELGVPRNTSANTNTNTNTTTPAHGTPPLIQTIPATMMSFSSPHDVALEREARETLGIANESAMRARRRVVFHIRQMIDAYFAPVFGPKRGPKPVLKPSGSFALGICDASSDVDLVCVFSSDANWETFHGLARHLQSLTTTTSTSNTSNTSNTAIRTDSERNQRATSHLRSRRRSPSYEIRHVTYISRAAVPLISFDFLLHNSPASSSVGTHRGGMSSHHTHHPHHPHYSNTTTNMPTIEVKVDLLFVRLPIPGPLPAPDHLPLDDDAVLVGMDSASVKGLNGVRSASMIMSMVDHPNPRVYLDALRIVRKWAKSRVLYGFKYGFLGGISWAISVATVYTDLLRDLDDKGMHLISSTTGEPTVTACVVVRSFFARMCCWKWPEPVELCHYRNNPMLDFAVRPWDPTISKHDAQHVMPVLTPVRPVQNTSTSVTKSTREVLRQEFWLAHCHLSRSAMSSPDLAPNTLKTLVGDSPFFAAHELFVEICIEMDSTLFREKVVLSKTLLETPEKRKNVGRSNDTSSTPEENHLKDSLYAFISGGASSPTIAAAASVAAAAASAAAASSVLSPSSDESSPDASKRATCIEKMDEKLHSFVNFVESKMRDLVCTLEETKCAEFQKEHGDDALQCVVHPFTRPFYDLDEDGTKAGSTTNNDKSPSSVVDALPSRNSHSSSNVDEKISRRAYFYLALKGVAVQEQLPIKIVKTNAKYWIDSVRSQYKFSNMTPRTEPEEAPKMIFRILQWKDLPDIVFSSSSSNTINNDSPTTMYTRQQAIDFRHAQSVRLQMQYHQMQQQLQFHHHHHRPPLNQHRRGGRSGGNYQGKNSHRSKSNNQHHQHRLHGSSNGSSHGNNRGNSRSRGGKNRVGSKNRGGSTRGNGTRGNGTRGGRNESYASSLVHQSNGTCSGGKGSIHKKSGGKKALLSHRANQQHKNNKKNKKCKKSKKKEPNNKDSPPLTSN